jgi:hypothetical protein
MREKYVEMGYHPRIESSEKASFLTTRARNSELWFVNNPGLEDAVLGFAAKYTNRYGVKLYALAIEGNHTQAPALFPSANRASFMRDLNSSIARAVPRFVSSYPGGKFWGRRYSSEFLPGADDIEEWFFYTVLQPVKDGLIEKISEYPGYNCFHDAVWGKERKFKVVNWAAYNARRRFDASAQWRDFIEVHVLKYERLPGYEGLSQREYALLMHKKLEERRVQIVAERNAKGLRFAGRSVLLSTPPGASPRSTKRSDINSHRPRVLCVCPVRRQECIAWYFQIYFQYREASKEFRGGKLNAEFPSGTYPPWRGVVITAIAA